MNDEQLLAQIINGIRAGQQQGAFGNVTDNEMTMFSGNPMNGAVAGGAVGNVTDKEASLFNMMAGGVSNPMPRINEMRNNLATAGSVGNASNTEANIFTGKTNQEINEIQVARANLSRLKRLGQTRILTDGEKSQAMQAQEYLQNISSPVEVMPPDIDNLNLSPEGLREFLNTLENPNFRGFPMREGR